VPEAPVEQPQVTPEQPPELPQPDEGTIELHDDHTVTLPPPPIEPKTKGLEQIDIDRQGTLRRAEEYVPEVKPPQKEETPQEASLPGPDDMLNQPTATISKKYSSFVQEPPSMGGTLTASSQDDVYDPSVDPLSVIPKADSTETPGGESTPSPLLSVQDDSESVLADQIPSTDNPMLSHDGEYNVDKPLGPKVDNNETIEQIEDNVEKYEGSGQQEKQQQEADAARRAVYEAVDNAYDPTRPDPIQSLNAQPMLDEDDLNGAPPMVPPPIVPPFPLPPEADGNEQPKQ